MSYEEQAILIESIQDLRYQLSERRRHKRNQLFNCGGEDRLRDILNNLRDAHEDGHDGDFIAIATKGLRKFFSHAELTETGFHDELESLRHLRKTVDEIGKFMSSGFGEEGKDVTAESQKVVMWLRELEKALETIDKNRKPK